MRIVVLVKHVPCAAGDHAYAPDLTLAREGVRRQLNDVDACAVEQALRIALPRSEAQLTAVTMGPAAAVQALHRALILGADEGVHILDDALHGCDALATSRVLATAVSRLGFDLVLCGCSTSDSGTSTVPAMVAERLGVPVVCFADALRISGDRVRARCLRGREPRMVTAGLPAVVSVTQRCGPARVPRHAAVVRARHKLVRTWSLSRLGISRQDVSPATRVRSIRPATGRPRTLIQGDAATAAVRLADFLAERELL